MVKFVSRDSSFADAIKYMKKVAEEQLAVKLDRLITRPLFPEDFGKSNWVWAAKDSFTVPDGVFLLITGIYSRELIGVRLEVGGTIIGILATGSPLHEYFICVTQNTYCQVRTVYLGANAKEPSYEFSITGLAIEFGGRSIVAFSEEYRM